jgi:hypothetical protein
MEKDRFSKCIFVSDGSIARLVHVLVAGSGGNSKNTFHGSRNFPEPSHSLAAA